MITGGEPREAMKTSGGGACTFIKFNSSLIT